MVHIAPRRSNTAARLKKKIAFAARIIRQSQVIKSSTQITSE